MMSTPWVDTHAESIAGLEPIAQCRKVSRLPGEATVAERVDEQDAGVESLIAKVCLRKVEPDQLCRVDSGSNLLDRGAGRQVRCHRCEEVAAVEGVRDARAPHRRILERVRGDHATQPFCGREQQSVVGSYQAVAARHLERDGASCGADAGVDHGEVHADRQVGHRGPEQECAVTDAELAAAVGQVVDASIRQDRPDHAAADGGRRVVAEVGQEGQVRAGHAQAREIRTGRSGPMPSLVAKLPWLSAMARLPSEST